MLRVGSDETAPFDFWDYFNAIPEVDFKGCDCSDGSVDYVYRDEGGQYEHVLINSNRQSLYMVLVLDLANARVVGHRLLDLNDEYGLPPRP